MRLMQLITGHWVAAAVHSVAKLGVARASLQGPNRATSSRAASNATPRRFTGCCVQ